MALRLSQSPTYRWPVKVVLPTDGGRHETFTFDAEFRRLKQSRIAELVEVSQRQQRGEVLEGDEDMSDVDVLDEIMAGWDGIEDDDGEAIAFSRVNLARLCELPTVAAQIMQAFIGSLQKAKAKN